MRDDADPVRRTLLAAGGLGLASLPATAAAAAPPPPAPVDKGAAQGGGIEFPPIHDPKTERAEGQPPNSDGPDRRVGFAIVGLGRLALQNIIPAIGQSKHARVTALVSGDPEKMRVVAAQLGIGPEHCYGYDAIERLRDDATVQAVYVVTPNALHRDHVVRAARAGKHVLCEKPMATSPAEAREMVAACRDAGRLLMIAYRCQYEVYNREVIRRVRAGELGQVRAIVAVNTQAQGDPSQWRQRKALAGGGALPDIGLYCLNSSRAVLGEEPVEVTAQISTAEGDPRFREVESDVAFTLRFPSGALAHCYTSYAAHERRDLQVLGTKATADLANAFAYEGQRLTLNRLEGDAVANAEISKAHHDQFALEIDHFAECVRSGAKPRTPGEEGVQDQVIMAAIYESARTRRPVALPRVEGRDAFRGPEPAPPG